MAYINKEKLIADILSHKARVGCDNDFYQLAHDHLINIINLQEAIHDPEEMVIYGYRVKDLIIYAERLRLEGVSPYIVKAKNEDFLDGYKTAHDEFNRQLQESIDKIIGRDDPNIDK